MTTAVLVPRRPDGGRRDKLWAWCSTWWAQFGWPIVEGHHTGGPFNVSAARNLAARRAGDWTTAVLIDADGVLADPDQLHRAIATATRTGRLTLAHDRWRGLNRRGSDWVLTGWAGNWGRYVEIEKPMTWSSCLVITRDLWEQVGGYDERFIGWGFEDTAFVLACKALGGGLEREHGDLFHLWHPTSPEKNSRAELYRANRQLRKRYSAVGTDRDGMLELLAEAGAPRAAVPA